MAVVENATCRHRRAVEALEDVIRRCRSIEDVKTVLQVLIARGTKYDIDFNKMTQTNQVSEETQNICIRFSLRVRQDLSATILYVCICASQHVLEFYLLLLRQFYLEFYLQALKS